MLLHSSLLQCSFQGNAEALNRELLPSPLHLQLFLVMASYLVVFVGFLPTYLDLEDAILANEKPYFPFDPLPYVSVMVKPHCSSLFLPSSCIT
jgi:hypothetical protein